MDDQFKTDLTDKLTNLVDSWQAEISKYRTGQAHPSLLDDLMIETDIGKVTINQLATILAPKAQLLTVRPFEATNIKPIVEAISANQDLGLNPTDDGQVIYLNLPPLTADRSQQIVKNLQQKKENFLVRLRQLRHEAQKDLKASGLPEDDWHRSRLELEKLITDFKERIEALAQDKVKQILSDGSS